MRPRDLRASYSISDRPEILIRVVAPTVYVFRGVMLRKQVISQAEFTGSSALNDLTDPQEGEAQHRDV